MERKNTTYFGQITTIPNSGVVRSSDGTQIFSNHCFWISIFHYLKYICQDSKAGEYKNLSDYDGVVRLRNNYCKECPPDVITNLEGNINWNTIQNIPEISDNAYTTGIKQMTTGFEMNIYMFERVTTKKGELIGYTPRHIADSFGNHYKNYPKSKNNVYIVSYGNHFELVLNMTCGVEHGRYDLYRAEEDAEIILNIEILIATSENFKNFQNTDNNNNPVDIKEITNPKNTFDISKFSERICKMIQAKQPDASSSKVVSFGEASSSMCPPKTKSDTYEENLKKTSTESDEIIDIIQNIENLNNQNTFLTREIKNVEIKITNVQKEIEEIQKELSALENILKKYTTDIENINKTIATIKNNNKNENCGILQEDIEYNEKMITKIKENIQELNNKLSNKQKEKELKFYVSALKNYKQQQNNIGSQIAKLKAELNTKIQNGGNKNVHTEDKDYRRYMKYKTKYLKLKNKTIKII